MSAIKEVKTLVSKKDFYLTIFELLKQGLNPAQISKRLNISKQSLNYYIRQLKNNGSIEKKGYGVWEVKTLVPKIVTKSQREIRGHAFIWVVKVPRDLNLREKARLIGKELNKGQIKLFIKNHKVWIGKESIVVYESKSFYGKNSIESRKFALINLLEVLREIEFKFNIKLKRYIFKPSKEHYGLIKNDLARQYNRQNKKLVVHDDLEGDWLWIDDSESLGELETKNIVRSKQVQDWWNDNKKHDFKVTPSFLLNTINQVTENQQMFGKNLETHIKAIKKLSKSVDELTKKIKELSAFTSKEKE